MLHECVPALLGLGLGQDAFFDQLVLEHSVDVVPLPYLLVHEWLREFRRVNFVVPVLALSDEVDDHVLLEGVAVLDGSLEGVLDLERLLGVDVDDGAVRGAPEVGGLEPVAVVGRVGGEADLVVDHHVDRAARGEVGQVAHLHELLVDALALEGRVAVQQHRDVLGAVHQLVGAHTLLLLRGTSLALAGRVDGVQVRGVGQHHDVDFALLGHALLALPHVLLHIAGLALLVELVLDVLAREFPEYLPERFAGEVVQDAQPAPVRHAERDLVHVVVNAGVDDSFESDVEGLDALDAEPLGSGKLLAELLFEAGHLLQPLQQLQLADCGLVVFPLEECLCLLAHPDQPVVPHDVADLPADRAALGVVQELHDLPQLHRLVVTDDSAVEPLAALLSAVVDQEVVVHVAVQVLVGWFQDEFGPRLLLGRDAGLLLLEL